MKHLIITTLLCSLFISTGYSQKIKNNYDTLDVACTYWWPYGGPFIGMCGERYSIVFVGTVTKVYQASKPHTLPNDSIEIFTPQKGVIRINEIKFKSSPHDESKKKPLRKYAGQAFFSSDCFSGLDLKEGDKVLTFIYSYEGDYSIPARSILKVKDFNDPVILSIEKYIKSNQNPLAIRGDTTLWAKYEFDWNLKQIIECKVSNE
jgi:hypothetical protein